MSLSNIRIVLVSPIYGGNIGSVCRAMKNMGLSQLVLAAPRDDVDWDMARKMALHAADILDARQEYPTLKEAVADCGLVVGTSNRKGLYRSHSQSPREWAPQLLEGACTSPVAIVFGPEDNGLALDDLKLSTHMIQIPSTPEYSSLNLSQAVIICCYELYLASGEYEPPEELSEDAPSVMREAMFTKWRKALLGIGFMKEDKADHMMLGLRRILSRGKLTEKDVQILLGMASQTIWCAEEMERYRKEVETKRDE